MVLHLPPRHLPMRKAPLSLSRDEWVRRYQVVSHPVYCRICDVTVEAIGSTPQEAEKRAIDVYAGHCKQFHQRVEH